MIEKAERLVELEKQNEKKRNDILNKIKTMDSKKEIFEKNKYEKILENKKLREQRFASCLKNRKEMLVEENERRKDILFYQSIMLGRSLSRDNIFRKKRLNASEKTVNEQMTLEKNLTLFNKKMDDASHDRGIIHVDGGSSTHDKDGEPHRIYKDNSRGFFLYWTFK